MQCAPPPLRGISISITIFTMHNARALIGTSTQLCVSTVLLKAMLVASKVVATAVRGWNIAPLKIALNKLGRLPAAETDVSPHFSRQKGM